MKLSKLQRIFCKKNTTFKKKLKPSVVGQVFLIFLLKKKEKYKKKKQ